MASGPRDDAGTLSTSYDGADHVPAEQAVDPPARAGVQPHDRIGRYIVEEPLGQGGMGVVVAARDPELARQVALKVVRPGVGDRPYRKRLVREARAMAKLEHANVVRVYDAGEVDGEVFVAMELVRGETLGQWLRAARRPWREVIARFIAAGRGLAAAHHAGLVHRDFKPDNVLVRASDGRVCVTDFGLAVPAVSERGEPDAPASPAEDRAPASSGDTTLTRTGTAVGTPAYMAPEQRRGEEVDARADVFSFCVSLHEGLYGVRPFDAHAARRPTEPGSRRALERTRRASGERRVPGAVRRAIARGLSLDPAARWPAIDPLLAVLERATRRRTFAIAAAVAAAALAVVAAIAVSGSRTPPGQAGVPPPFTYERARRVTFAAGCEEEPAFLADGRLAYVKRSGASTTLHVGDSDSADAGAVLGTGAAPAISPSGRYLAALDRTTVLIRDLQHPSEPPRTRGTSTGGLGWLGDREIIVGVDSTVVARPIDGGDDRVIALLPGGGTLRAVTVGANGRIFGIHRAEVSIAEDFLVEILPGAPGQTRELRRGVYWPAGVRYRAASNLIYFVQRMNSTQYHLFRLPADAKIEPTSMVSDIPPTGGFDISPDARHLVFSTCGESGTIGKLSRSGPPIELTQRGNWRDSGPAVVDGNRFVYSSTRGGELQVWLHDGAGHADRPLTKPESSYPALSPDRTTLVYAAFNEAGTGSLVVRPLETATPAHDATSGFLDRAPRFTRDGASLLFVRDTPGGIRLHRVAVAGGPVSEVMSEEVRLFDVSPVDDTVAFVTRGRERDHLRTVSLRTGVVGDAPGADLIPPKPKFVRFSPDGATVVVVDRDGIVELDLTTGAVQPRWRVEGSAYIAVAALDFDADGTSLVASLVDSDGDLWIAEGRF